MSPKSRRAPQPARKNHVEPSDALFREKFRYTLREALVLLGISETTFWRRQRDGDIRTVRDGRRTYVTADELRRYAATDRPNDSAA